MNLYICMGIPRGAVCEHQVRAFIITLDTFRRSLVRYGPHGAKNQVVGYATLLRCAVMEEQGFGLATNLQWALISYQVSAPKAKKRTLLASAPRGTPTKTPEKSQVTHQSQSPSHHRSTYSSVF